MYCHFPYIATNGHLAIFFCAHLMSEQEIQSAAYQLDLDFLFKGKVCFLALQPSNKDIYIHIQQ